MKMDLAKMHGCLAVSILPLLLLVDPAAACYCLDSPPITLQTAYCASDVVIKGSFANAKFESNDKTWATYVFKVTQVFKGPSNIGEVNLRTQILGTTCGYRHNDPFGEDEYVVTGSLEEDNIIISVCSFIKRWSGLTDDEKAGLDAGYSSGCS